jgi:hypothetical protein
VVTDEFFRLAQTEARARGMVHLPLVKVPHPVGTMPLDSLKSLAQRILDAIIAHLLHDPDGAARAIGPEIRPGRFDAGLMIPSSPRLLLDAAVARGWSDGLPILPPTRLAVEEMMATVGLDKSTSFGKIPPLNGMATLEKLAANAVMAGCLPEYFPLVIAAARGLLQKGFNLDGVQTTTGNVAPVLIVNGPCRDALGINSGANALGQGWRANATIGRAIRLILTNIGGAAPGQFDKSTLGQPAKYTFCFGENEENSPWEPLHVERGIDRRDSAASITGCSAIISAVDMASQGSEGLLKTFALAMAGGLTSGVTSTEVLLVICPEHAAILAAGGHSKATLREELFRRARVPLEKISHENIELLEKRRPAWFTGNCSDEIGAVDRPDDIWLVVAGGAGAKSAYIPGRTGTHMQTVAVE